MHTPARHALAAITLILVQGLSAQTLPPELYFSADGHRLHTGGQPSSGLYQKELIRTLDLQFDQPNYWDLLLQNYTPGIDLPATLVVEGVTYDSVGVRFKGQTSYTQLPPGAQKRSFNITLDHVHPDQELMGYGTLNLNNAFQDASFLREVVYLELIRDHIPAAKANFVHLNINGENWGIYPNVQQLNNDFIKEWYFSNDGTLWRADRPDGLPNGGGGPGGGPGWGDGTAALNYLGPDTTTYQTYYTLKRTEQVDPWDDLVITCLKLNTVPLEDLQDSLAKYMDLDRTLWYLASEIAFSDDDSYIYKGKMDYYLYWDAETGWMNLQEFDGNSVMKLNNTNWSPFYNATNPNYPLMNRLFAVPELRQRYLAHLRTIISEKMQSGTFNALVDGYAALIDAEVQADPKKLYSYASFLNEVTALKNYISNRRNYLLSNPEVAQPAPTITGVEHRVDGVAWAAPTAAQSVDVRATVTSGNGISSVTLYHSTGLLGGFTRTPMFDDGQHDDGAAGDGLYGASIPAAPGYTWVRYYIEAAANNPARTVVYDPPGAEHDVYIYQVQHLTVPEPTVRINELMARNTNTVMDEFGQYDDWVELYNTSSEPVDLGGGWLSDNGANLQKWPIPEGTVIGPGAYLIFWADDDGTQGPVHTTFNLSADGEEVWLTRSDGLVMDQVAFGPQEPDMGYARVPNGSGPFVVQSPTFAANNDLGVAVMEAATMGGLRAFPNPASTMLHLLSDEPQDIVVHDALGRRMWEGRVMGRTDVGVDHWANGPYYIRHGKGVLKLVVAR